MSEILVFSILVFTKSIFGVYQKKVNFLFILYFLLATCNVSPSEKRGAENAKTKIFSKQTQIILIPKYSPPSN